MKIYIKIHIVIYIYIAEREITNDGLSKPHLWNLGGGGKQEIYEVRIAIIMKKSVPNW